MSRKGSFTKEELEAMAENARKARESQLKILIQGFYGNRTTTYIDHDDFDNIMLGYLGGCPTKKLIDRTIINIPNTANLVLVYNKHQESEELKRKEELKIEENYTQKPLAFIPEKNIEIYSRCIVCRINADGTFANVESEDYDKVFKYLAQ